MLKEVCARVAAHVPAGGTLARLGGDELVMLLPGLSAEDAEALVRRMTAALAEPLEAQGMALHLGASAGVTVLRLGEGIWVAFQPVVDANSLRPKGLEALVRWSHPTRGRVGPDEFIPLAERAGLMPELTRTVLRLSLDQAVELRRQGWSIPVSVNLTAGDLLDTTLLDFVEDALAVRELAGPALRIEITESLIVDRGPRSTMFLGALRELGIELAVDDFGTGYSCLAYLHDLPVSYLKIDKSFVDRVLDDERTAVIVASTVDMAHQLGMAVVAEGVEDAGQLTWLGEHACDLIQGYHTGRPMPAEELQLWLTRQPRAPRVPRQELVAREA